LINFYLGAEINKVAMKVEYAKNSAGRAVVGRRLGGNNRRLGSDNRRLRGDNRSLGGHNRRRGGRNYN